MKREVSLFKARPGGTTAAHSTALGKAILTGMDPQTFECALDRSGVRRSTGKTITNWPTCRKICNSFAPAALPLIGENRLKGVLYWVSVAELLRNGYRGCWGFYGSATFPKLELNRLASQVDAAAAELWYELGYDPGSLKERRAG